MSIDVMREVWKHADFKGGALLVFLAMADWADDEGGSIFPKVETLAKKSRLSVRGAQMALRELEDAGVIEKVIEATGRPGRATEYKIILERVKNVQASPKAETGAVSNRDGCSLQHEGVQSETGRVQSVSAHIDNHHSIHHENPSSDPPAASPPGPQAGDVISLFPDLEKTPVKAKGKKRLDPGELEAAFELYDQAAEQAGWSVVQMRSEARKSALTNRLKELGGIDGWRVALQRALASDFCCGKCPPTPPRTKAFKADFDFLTQQQSLIRLMEGKYDSSGSGDTLAAGSGYFAAAARLEAADTARDRH